MARSCSRVSIIHVDVHGAMAHMHGVHMHIYGAMAQGQGVHGCYGTPLEQIKAHGRQHPSLAIAIAMAAKLEV